MLNVMLFPYANVVIKLLEHLSNTVRIVLSCILLNVMIPNCLAMEPVITRDQGTVETLRATLQEIKQRHNIPCLSLGWVKDCNAPVQTVTLGCDAQAVLRWGSITKTLTALTVLDLAAEDLIDLYAPISIYLDSRLWDNAWQTSQPIRVIDLLELRAGFTDLSGRAFNYNQPMPLAQALAFERDQLRTFWPPGLQHSYSNLTPGLSQLLIETVSGESYADAVNKRIFTPLQMNSAGFKPGRELLPGYQADGITPIPYWQMTFAAFGAANASTEDMLKLLAELLEPTVLSEFELQHLRTPHGRRYLPEFRFDYAAGFYPRIRRGFTWHNHGGDADGYRSRLSIMSDHPRGYVANISSDNPAALREVERAIENFLIADLASPDIPAVFDLPVAELAALTGQYYPSQTRFGLQKWQSGQMPGIEVVLRNKQLWFVTANKDTPLFATSAHQFRRASDPVATLAFVRVGQDLFLQGELGHYARLTTCPTFLSFLRQCNHR